MDLLQSALWYSIGGAAVPLEFIERPTSALLVHAAPLLEVERKLRCFALIADGSHSLNRHRLRLVRSLRRILAAYTGYYNELHAFVVGQGFAEPAARPTVRSPHRAANSRQTSSSILPDVVIGRDTSEIHVNHRVPVIDLQSIESRSRGDSGVVEKKVEFAKTHTRELDQGGQITSLRYIRALADCLPSCFCNARDDGLKLIQSTGTEHSLCAVRTFTCRKSPILSQDFGSNL